MEKKNEVANANPGLSGFGEADGYQDDDYEPCMTCGGEGYETSDQLMEEDPLWWEGVDSVTCRNCGGTGRMEDQQFF